MLKRFGIIFLVLIVLLVALVQAQDKKLEKKLVKKFNKKGKKDKKDKKIGENVKVFHHVHSSLDEAENIPKKEHVSKDAIKAKAGKGIRRMRHTDSELKQVAGTKSSADAGISEVEQKYKKVLDLAKKEKKIANGEVDKDETDLGMLKNVEKVAEKEMMKKHKVKTSDRMLASMKHLLMKLNGGTIQGADRYNMKKFVSNVFNRYRQKHEIQQERKKRILALEQHMSKDHDLLRHRPNFVDEFLEPHANGFDPYTYISVDDMQNVKLAHPQYPEKYAEKAGKIDKVPVPPEMRLSRIAKNHIVGDGDKYYLTRGPKMNLPLVEPPSVPADNKIEVTAADQVPKGLFPRMWHSIKTTLF